MPLTQDNRLISVTTPLGKDVLLLNHFSGTDALSSLFKFDLEMLAEPEAAAKVDPKKLLGRSTTISVKLADGTERYFNGIISRFSEHGSDQRFVSYRAEVVPWFWLLTLASDCRIFQDKTVPEIIEEVFADLGLTDFRLALTATYTKLDYCVQYRETHFNFVSRLMEKEGIFYYFEHEDGKHTMVIVDANSGCVPCPNQPDVRYGPEGGAGEREDLISDWVTEEELRPGKFTMRDFHFQMPSKPLEVSEESTIKVGGNDKLEVFDYPGEYAQRFNQPEKRLDKVEAEGRKMARIHMQEEESTYREVSGRSGCRDFTSGYRFKLTHHPTSELNAEYLLTSVQHAVAQSPDYYSGAGESAGTYQNSFRCVAQKIPFRAARVTPKPLVQGVQAAEVVGKKGEEIWTDKFGRVKVQFPWDRQGKRDESSSCWVRVSHPWAGGNWGAVAIPRIGQEVIVDFVEGDPDQPIITGRVYNADKMPPYALPANQTQTGMKSRSSKKGGPANFNEIRFEDKKGSEEVYIHAEKDENIIVENCKTESVGADETISIGNNRTETVGKNETMSVADNRTRSVGKNETVSVALARTHSVGVNEAISVGAAQEITVGAARAVTVGISQTVNIGKALSEDIGTDHTEKVGKKLTIDAGDQVSVTTGKASITMKKDGTITIKGKDITIQASGKITGKASGNIILKGKKILQN